jgi:hypothetical protein
MRKYGGGELLMEEKYTEGNAGTKLVILLQVMLLIL